MKKTFLILASFALLSVALPLHAQDGPGGCTDSPENPTAILAAVGSAGALFANIRVRIKARRDSSR
ncbi:MAG TPA: PExPT-CTERM protein [Edaphobacter sp.]|jgi:XrtJ-associated TM-motif-TM protein|nr:PExPT-CTERM protein [Edaphobacter sp.]